MRTEILHGVLALQAHNEAAAQNLQTNDVGTAQTRALYGELLALADRKGLLP